MTSPARTVAAALGLLALVGCYPKAKGEALEEKLAEQNERLAELESGIADTRQRMDAALETAETKVAELQEVLEQATAVVTRNSADLGTEVIQLREQLQAVEGSLAELQNELQSTQRQMGEQQQAFDQQIRRFAQKAGVDMAVDESQIPDDADDHFAAAQQALGAGEHSQARALFREFIRRYPEDQRADNAQYLVGKAYLVERRPANALGEFRRVISNYARGDAVDEALFDMADAFFQLHACTDAKAALEALIRGHRRSPLRDDARRKLRQINRAPASACTS
jgi:TolA-binding protein